MRFIRTSVSPAAVTIAAILSLLLWGCGAGSGGGADDTADDIAGPADASTAPDGADTAADVDPTDDTGPPPDVTDAVAAPDTEMDTAPDTEMDTVMDTAPDTEVDTAMDTAVDSDGADVADVVAPISLAALIGAAAGEAPVGAAVEVVDPDGGTESVAAGQVIVTVADAASDAAIGHLGALLDAEGWAVVGGDVALRVVQLDVGDETPPYEAVASLAALEAVAYARPNRLVDVAACVLPVDGASRTDALWPQHVRLESLWAIAASLAPRIGIVDCGVPAPAAYLPSARIETVGAAGGGGGHDHAARVAAVLAADGDAGAGVAGVAWNGTVLAYDACHSWTPAGGAPVVGATGYGVSRGVKAAVDAGAAVVNVAMAGAGCGAGDDGACRASNARFRADISDGVRYARGRALVVLSAGNAEGWTDDDALLPAALAAAADWRAAWDETVVVVSGAEAVARGGSDEPAYARRHTDGTVVDLLAPSVDVLVTSSPVVRDSGTSYAAAIVSGTAGLLHELVAERGAAAPTPTELKGFLLGGAVVAAEGSERQMLDAWAAALATGVVEDAEVCDGTCTPDCGDRVCGNDPICGAPCGTCADDETCEDGQCVPVVCTPDCADRVCGPDPICGASCGECGADETCGDGQCVPDTCTPDCSGLVCGPDPVCGLSCGDCGAGEACEAGACVCAPDCEGRGCGLDPVCGASCGTCGAGETCDAGICLLPNLPCAGDECLVPAGPFQMGCHALVDDDCGANELPRHEVTVPAFWIDRTEVTVAAYRACVDAGVCAPPAISDCNFDTPGRDDYPANCLSWYDATDYCTWAGRRLCTEAEWEKAARGPDGRKYPWGNTVPTCARANFDVCVEATDAVGGDGRCESPYGACDLAGNAWEWIEDDYHSTYVGAPTDGSAWTGPYGATRRGGGWDSDAAELRTSKRQPNFPPHFYDDFGFRCCRSAD